MITSILVSGALGALAGGGAAWALIDPRSSNAYKDAFADSLFYKMMYEQQTDVLERISPLVELGQRRQDAIDAQNRRSRAKRAPKAEGAVIVSGPQACGKTRNADALAAHFGCTNIVDDWDGRKPLAPGDLALTTDRDPYLVQDGARHVSFEGAMGWLNIPQEKAA